MKKFVMLVAVAALVFSFLPKADAGDSAQIGMSVTFDLSYPAQIDTLATAVKDHSFDINGDGVIDLNDEQFVVKAYELAKEYQAYLPDEILRILDVNCDGRIDGNDSAMVVQELAVYRIGNDISDKGNIAYDVYRYALDSGVPETIMAAIDRLSNIHGDIKPLIRELKDLAAVRPDLQQIIEEVILKGILQLKKIDSYVMELYNILHPLKIWSEPAGPFTIIENEGITFLVIAHDDNGVVGDIVCDNLPEGAEFYLNSTYGPGQHREGKFRWIPENGQSQDMPYDVTFRCRSDMNGDGDSDEEATVTVNIIVKPAPVISINLTPTSVYFNVKPGDAASEILTMTNTGTLTVDVDARYVDSNRDGVIDRDDFGGLTAGFPAGVDTFAASVNSYVIPGDGRRTRVESLLPGNESRQTVVTYHAPTRLTVQLPGNKYGMGIELRAYLSGQE